MVVIVGIAVTILFIILWRSGFLDDLMERGQARSEDRWRYEKDLSKTTPMNAEMAKRLEVFEEFMEELSDEDEE